MQFQAHSVIMKKAGFDSFFSRLLGSATCALPLYGLIPLLVACIPIPPAAL
jgi:hypothetical protein